MLRGSVFFFIFNPQPCLCLCLCVCIYMCVFSSKVFQTVLPPCQQSIAIQARIQTHSNMPGSWPQGQCSCLAHNSDWLEYQWWELNPKQLLTRDIKQSGEFSCGDLIMPPGKHVLAHKVALFNTTASKQLITLSKRLQGVTLLHPTVLQEETEKQMIKLHDNTVKSGIVSPLFHDIVF